MRRLLNPRSKVFRCMLLLAVMAWLSLGFGASVWAGPMQVAMATVGHANTSACDGMPMADGTNAHHHSVPQPAQGGHACCHHGCHCASLCGSMADVAGYRLARFGAYIGPQVTLPAAAVVVIGSPPLRPPIA